jgi:hypothetical protein
MTCRLRNDGARDWRLSSDEGGYRTYRLTLRVISNDPRDGPATVRLTPGLPLVGSAWQIDNDVDIWVWCRANVSVDPVGGEPGTLHWDVVFEYSNKPLDHKLQRCHDVQIEDPLLEPQKKSGGGERYVEEALMDRFGRPILTSSHEQIRGAIVEFDFNRDTVTIEQNVPALELDLCVSMKDHLNSVPMWGLPPRCIKLSDFHWNERFWGQCYRYFNRRFDFSAKVRKDPVTGLLYSGWDRDVGDEGSKFLFGHWDSSSDEWVIDLLPGNVTPDPGNPTHFIRAVDRHGNYIRAPLNGSGRPAGTIVTTSRGGGGMYVAIDNVAVGVKLSDGKKWVPIVGDIPQRIQYGPPWEWNSNTAAAGGYVRGNIVTWIQNVEETGAETGYYVAIAKQPYYSTFVAFDGPNDVNGQWLRFPFGIQDAGNYDPESSYALGDYVLDFGTSESRTGSGNIHIERYDEANFFFLGVPLILG